MRSNAAPDSPYQGSHIAKILGSLSVAGFAMFVSGVFSRRGAASLSLIVDSTIDLHAADLLTTAVFDRISPVRWLHC